MPHWVFYLWISSKPGSAHHTSDAQSASVACLPASRTVSWLGSKGCGLIETHRTDCISLLLSFWVSFLVFFRFFLSFSLSLFIHSFSPYISLLVVACGLREGQRSKRGRRRSRSCVRCVVELYTHCFAWYILSGSPGFYFTVINTKLLMCCKLPPHRRQGNWPSRSV